MSSEAQLQDGTTIGPYRVESLVGRGGMAEVYKVWHTGLHRHEALKLLPPAAALDATFVQRFLDEARMAARLHHPHIVTTYAVSEGDGPPFYFSMQLIEGGDLADLIQARHRLPARMAIPILKQIALALDYAHRHGVVHRDIKPGNILLESDDPLAVHRTAIEAGEEVPAWDVKVVDFGIARALGEGGNTRLTRAGMFMGTPEYMSPEQAGSGSPIDHRTDLYALGIVAYEMLCGRPPFRAAKDTSPLSIVVKHLNNPPPSPREFFPAIPEIAGEVLLRALAKDPSHRYVSCIAFIEALAAATAGMEASESANGLQAISDAPREYSRLAASRPPAAREENAFTAVVPLADRLRAEQGAAPQSEIKTEAKTEAAKSETEIKPEAVEEPAAGAQEDGKVSTLNSSLYSLFNKEEQAAEALPHSAFEFPTVAPPASTPAPFESEKQTPVPNENVQDKNVPSEKISAAAIVPGNVSTPPTAPKPVEEARRKNPLVAALAVLAALVVCAALGFGWWQNAQQSDAPLPEPAPIPTAIQNIAPLPTPAPRPTPILAPKPTPTAKPKAVVKISKPLKPKPQSTSRPRTAAQPRRTVRRIRRAPRVEYSPPRVIRRTPRIKRTRPRIRPSSRPRPTPRTAAPRTKSPDAY